MKKALTAWGCCGMLLLLMKNNPHLRFSSPNAKIAFPSFSIPAGHTCPGAYNCLTKRIDGKVVDLQKKDKHSEYYRCYAVSQEVVYKSLAKKLDDNFALLRGKTCSKMVELIRNSLNNDKETRALVLGGGALRVHIHGDFFNYDYLKAWFKIADLFPRIRFYSYTKSLQYLKRWKDEFGEFPSNYSLTWSKGSKFDNLGNVLGIKSVTVVTDEEEAKALGLEVDHDDTHALNGDEDFALEPHGTMPKGHPWGKAIIEKRKQGKFAGYHK